MVYRVFNTYAIGMAYSTRYPIIIRRRRGIRRIRERICIILEYVYQ
jgi:hypothetical protein